MKIYGKCFCICGIIMVAALATALGYGSYYTAGQAPPGEDPEDPEDPENISIALVVSPATECLGEQIALTATVTKGGEALPGVTVTFSPGGTDSTDSGGVASVSHTTNTAGENKEATASVTYAGETYTATATYTVEECECQISVGVEDKYYFCYDEGSGSVPVEIDKDCDAPDRKTENMDLGGNFTIAEDGDVWLGENTVKKWCENCDAQDSAQVYVAKIEIEDQNEPLYVCHDDEEQKTISLTDSFCENVNWKPDGLTGEADGHSFNFVPADQDPGEYTITAECANEELDCSDKRKVHIVKVKINQPDGDPSDPDQICFSLEDPGILTLECEAVDLGPLPEDGHFIWWVNPNVYSQSVEWDPPFSGADSDFGEGTGPVATWEGLPTGNNGFGEWDVELYFKEDLLADSLCTDETIIKVFYPPNSRNHPGDTEVPTDNFFYYYQQTPAGSNLAVFDPDTPHAGYTTFTRNIITKKITKAPDNINIGSSGIYAGAAGPYSDGPNIPSHIDSYKVVVEHETKHYIDYNSGLGHVDSDGDGIANYLEDANGNGIYEPELGETDPYDPESFYDIVELVDNRSPDEVKDGCHNDGEWRAYNAELTVIFHQCDDHDWTANGANWD